MNIAYIIYNGMTSLDFIGVFDPLCRLKTMNFISDLNWYICSISKDVFDSNQLQIIPSNVKKPLSDYDMIVVPGGPGSRKLIHDNDFIDWIRTAKICKLKVSVCTGALLLGAAGFLKGRKATTHPDAFNELKKFCEIVQDKRIVDEGDVITARGVTSSVDLGLYLCGKLAGDEVEKQIENKIDYLCYNSSKL